MVTVASEKALKKIDGKTQFKLAKFPSSSSRKEIDRPLTGNGKLISQTPSEVTERSLK